MPNVEKMILSGDRQSADLDDNDKVLLRSIRQYWDDTPEPLTDLDFAAMPIDELEEPSVAVKRKRAPALSSGFTYH